MIRYFTAHPTASILLSLAVAIAGLWALPAMQRDTFPDFLPDRLEIRATYPGATAEEVEETVCLALEDALDVVQGIAEQTCTARAGVGLLQLEVRHGHDTGRLLVEVKAEVDAIATFPPEVDRPVVRQLDTTDPVVSLALVAPVAETVLRTFAEDIRSKLLRLPGVAEVRVGGFSDRTIEVALDEHRLNALGLSAPSIAAIIERQSLDLPAGSVRTGEQDVLVRVADRRRTAGELGRIVVREIPGGGTVRLADVATLAEGFLEPEVRIEFDGERAAMLEIRRGRDEDALRVLGAVQQFVTSHGPTLPPGVRLALTNDASSLIADRLRLLVKNALQGFVLICLVLWVFFSARFSVSVAMALPLSLLGAVFLMNLFGLNLNLITTASLLISLGLLIDAAVVINENIARHIERGAGVLEAAGRGVNEVSGAVLASFLTSVAIFTPLAFLEGNIGRVMLVLPIILIMVLAVSLVISFLALPWFTARALHSRPRTALRARMDAALERFRDRAFGAVVRLAVRWRYATVGLVALVFLASLSLVAGGTVKFQAFPDIEGDIAEARLMLAAGSAPERTDASVQALLAALERAERRLSPANPDAAPLVRQVSVEFGRNADFRDAGPYLATIRVDLLGSEYRGVPMAAFLSAWREETGELTDTVSLSFTEPALGPAGMPIEIRLAGADLEVLGHAGDALAAHLARFEGISDIVTDFHAGPQQLRVSLREGATRLGISSADVAAELRGALHGITADEIIVGRESVRIDVRNRASWRSDLGRLDDFTLPLADGSRVPLQAVAEIVPGRGQVLIPRVDGRRTLTVTADVDTRRANANEVLAAIDHAFPEVLARDYPGVDMRFAGAAAEQAETGGSMQRVFLVGLLAMFIVLSLQFRSWLQPLIVMIAIPLAFTGVVLGHWLMGLDLSMPSLVGFVSLSGIVVNSSILLVVFTQAQLATGRSAPEAAVGASLDRFRAIVVTTATTVAGLVPLVFETSVQAQVLVPLVTSLAFGLTTATVLVLTLLPALYVILDELRPRAPDPQPLQAVE